MTVATVTDHATKGWIRNASDKKAAAAGCRFDEARGRFVVEWIERYCVLYEGEYAGQPLRLTDWQLDCTLRLFSWVRWSERWQREIRRFRQASLWMAKKNKKTPTLAAWGLYLLAGDGEMGQKVFLAAKDGKQARELAGKHMVEMVLASVALAGECSLNRNTQTVTHLPTRSTMAPMSSSNSRTRESKEGLNGSVLIDEVHVVDADFVSRISRAGISRSEPLQIEVSTAGNNPDGYGRQRFDYARQVEKGEVEDQELFVSIHAAPQDLTDEELEADPLRYGRMANPAMGHTVDPEEYLKDYATSKAKGQHALAEFKMYRLNVWQKGANPWLRESDWEQCRKDFVEADLEGRECWAGLDLARTRDMSALVLEFLGDEPEEVWVLPYFWLPEDRAKEIAHLCPVMEWARAGWIELTPGGVTDYGRIKAKFRRLCDTFFIRELAYDPKFAEEVTQSLEQGETDDAGAQIVEGTGVLRFAFAQTDANYAAPTEDFERLVLAHKLRHAGHPVLSWQAGHATVMRKISGVKRVVKPKAVGHQTVDGIHAGIMALARLAGRLGGSSVYESRGVMTLSGEPEPPKEVVAATPEAAAWREMWRDDAEDD